jgi:hypothetical protein
MKLKFRNIGLYLILVITLTTLITCSNEYEQWQAEAITMVKSANDITQDEYENLVDIIQSSPDDFRIFLNDDKSVNHKKLHENLITLFASKKIEISPDKIYSPVNSKKISENSKFNVNVFLENSASMDGYVNGKTDFETAIYSLLGDIKINGFCDSLNLNYINSSIHTFNEPDIADFIDKLEPATFQKRGGNRSTSDLSEVIKTVTSKVDNRNASILISDFVFSPGKQKNLDARDYLNNQMLGIRLTFAQLLQKQKISAVVLHLESAFNGQYFDLTDYPHNYSGKRPYYIWVIGTDEQVKQILATKILDNIKGGVQHKLVLNQVAEPRNIDFKIAKSPKIGTFELPNGKLGPIESASYDNNRNKGIFGFTFYANFENEMQNSSFYLDKKNYKWNPNYELEISTVTDNNDPATKFYTHMYKLETKDLKSETFSLEVIGKTPDWVVSLSSENDSGINPDNDESSKTFGFKYLIDGVSEAFYPNNKINIINKLEIAIKR